MTAESPRTALVTGASSGIGRALARKAAAEGFDLILVARDRTRLEATVDALRRELGALSRIIALDLAAPGAVDRLRASLGEPAPRIDLLVNNAGFALNGDICDIDPAAEASQLRLQVDVTVALTHLVLPSMRALGAGHILNIASVYSFIPAAHQAAYGAGKAFLFSYSAALAQELRGDGVGVTVVAPGATRTDFRSRAGLGPASERGGMSAEAVADAAWRGMMAGRLLVVPGRRNRLFLALMALVPWAHRAAVMAAINARRGLSRKVARKGSACPDS